MFFGRASDTQEITVCGAFKTPCGETLYIVEIKFRKEVAGSFRLTMAVLHRNMIMAVPIEPEMQWTDLAAICANCSVRIIGGHLPRGKHQLITELEKVMPTTTILANKEHPHPYCVLGGIQTTVGTSSRVPFCVNQVEPPDTKSHGLVRFPMITVNDPETSVANTTKCLLLVHGSNTTRPREDQPHLLISSHRRIGTFRKWTDD